MVMNRDHSPIPSDPDSFTALQRSQEIQQVLLLHLREAVEFADHDVGFREKTLVRANGGDKIGRSAIMEEEYSLSQSP
jgi:hypothetical protein